MENSLILCLAYNVFSFFSDTRYEHWRGTSTDGIFSEKGCQVCADGMHTCIHLCIHTVQYVPLHKLVKFIDPGIFLLNFVPHV